MSTGMSHQVPATTTKNSNHPETIQAPSTTLLDRPLLATSIGASAMRDSTGSLSIWITAPTWGANVPHHRPTPACARQPFLHASLRPAPTTIIGMILR